MTKDDVANNATDPPAPAISLDGEEKTRQNQSNVEERPASRNAPGRAPLFRDRLSINQKTGVRRLTDTETAFSRAK